MNFASLTKSLKEKQVTYFPWGERVFLYLAVLLAYASVWPNEFVFDDRNLIILNEFLKHWGSLPKLLTSRNYTGSGFPGTGFYRPVQMLIYFLVYQSFGLSTTAFHTLNISLHCLNACLLHHFGIRAGFKKGVAFAAALLWAVHPIQTSDVAYMSSTAELLWSSFCLLGLITLLPDFKPRKIWKAMIFFILALGSKESAVVFPALAAITFFFVSKDRIKTSAYLMTWPLWLLTTGFIAIWLLFMHTSHFNMDITKNLAWFQYYSSNLPNRIITSLASLPVYAQLIVWPAGLHIERFTIIFPTLMALQPAIGVLMVVLGLLQVLWSRMKRGLALSFGLLWFAVTLSPYSGIVTPVDAVLCEGWMYMPTMGLFLGATQTASVFFTRRQNTARLVVMALALSLGIMTFFQNEVWRNIETLYQNVTQNGGVGNRLRFNLILFLVEHQEFDKAIKLLQTDADHLEEYDPAKRAAIHLQLALAWLHIPLNQDGNSNLGAVGRALPYSQHIPEAIGELGKVLQEEPDNNQAHLALAAIYRYQGNTQMSDFHNKRVREILQGQGNPSP
jgi:hypothetical protein